MRETVKKKRAKKFDFCRVCMERIEARKPRRFLFSLASEADNVHTSTDARAASFDSHLSEALQHDNTQSIIELSDVQPMTESQLEDLPATQPLEGEAFDGSAKAAHAEHTERTIVLDRWSLNVVFNKNTKRYSLGVRGTRSDTKLQCHSSSIAELRSSCELLTQSGTCYVLRTAMDIKATLLLGFTGNLVLQFIHGFPSSWRELADEFFATLDADGKRAPQRELIAKKRALQAKPSAAKRAKREVVRENSDDEFDEPILQLNTLPKTRSGRAVKPRQEFWRNQAIHFDKHGNVTAIDQGFADASTPKKPESKPHSEPKPEVQVQNEVQVQEVQEVQVESESESESDFDDLESEFESESFDALRKSKRRRQRQSDGESSLSFGDMNDASDASDFEEIARRHRNKESNVAMPVWSATLETFEGWTMEEIARLKKALKNVAPTHPAYWSEIAARVGRSDEECQTCVDKLADSKRKSAAKPQKNEQKAVKGEDELELEGGKGTLKRKRGLREILKAKEHGHADDYLASTPARAILDRLEISLEDDDSPRLMVATTPMAPATRRIPMTNEVDQTLSPASPEFLKNVDRDKLDAYIDRMKRVTKGKQEEAPNAKQNAKQNSKQAKLKHGVQRKAPVLNKRILGALSKPAQQARAHSSESFSESQEFSEEVL